MKWRVQEWFFLEELSQSKDGSDLLKEAHNAGPTHKWWKDALHWFVTRYNLKFSEAFGVETVDELAARKKIQPRAMQSPFPAESEEDRQLRLAGISQVGRGPHVDVVHMLTLAKRIGSYIKRKSPNYKRNKADDSRKLTSPVTAPATIADLVKPNSTTASTNAYRLFAASDHPSRPQTTVARDGRGDLGAYATACAEAYKTLPEREASAFKSTAQKMNAARHAVSPPSPQDRDMCVFLARRILVRH